MNNRLLLAAVGVNIIGFCIILVITMNSITTHLQQLTLP